MTQPVDTILMSNWVRKIQSTLTPDDATLLGSMLLELLAFRSIAETGVAPTGFVHIDNFRALAEASLHSNGFEPYDSDNYTNEGRYIVLFDDGHAELLQWSTEISAEVWDDDDDIYRDEEVSGFVWLRNHEPRFANYEDQENTPPHLVGVYPINFASTHNADWFNGQLTRHGISYQAQLLKRQAVETRATLADDDIPF